MFQEFRKSVLKADAEDLLSGVESTGREMGD
jgi:hypothetical protein